MIPYELAKKIKDAGFPQGVNVLGVSHYFVGKERVGYVTNEGKMDGMFHSDDLSKDWCKIPTLEEAIGACGDAFECIYRRVIVDEFSNYRTSGWIAYGFSDDKYSMSSYQNPLEAVLRLWLALNTK